MVILICATILVFSYFGYPPQGNNDGAWFIVPGINYALTDKLENPIDWGQSELRLGNGRFLSYPPLFPLFVSLFIFPSSNLPFSSQIFIAIGIINSLVIILSALVLYKVATINDKRLDWLMAIIICASLFLIFRASWSFNGRPEILVRLFFTIGFLWALSVKKPWLLVGGLGLLLGLTAATHVLAPIIFFALILFLFSLKFDFWTSIKHISLTSIIGLLSFITVMQLSPFGIIETLGGIYQHGRLMLDRLVPGRSIFSFLANPNIILYSAVGFILIFFGIRFFRQTLSSQKLASPSLLFSSSLLAFVYAAFVIIDVRNYYIAPFVLLIFCAALYYIAHVRNSRLITYSIVSFLALLVIFSLKNIALFPFFLKDGMSLSFANSKVREIVSQSPGKPIMLGGSHLWTLSEEYGRMVMDIPHSGINLGDYVYFLEEEEIPIRPEKIETCALRHDFYVSQIPKIFGIPVARAIPGYGFAAYECRS